MADPAPSAPLPDAAPERRVSPADQMAALTGEPVELSRPEDDEPAEDRDVTQDPPDREPFEDGALRRCAGCLRPRQQIPQNRLNPRRNPKRPTRQFRPLPRATLRPPPNLTAIPPLRSRPLQIPEPPLAPPPRKPRTIRTRPRQAPRAWRR